MLKFRKRERKAVKSNKAKTAYLNFRNIIYKIQVYIANLQSPLPPSLHWYDSESPGVRK